jgi:fluoroacetyl-CoA thioesterase
MGTEDIVPGLVGQMELVVAEENTARHLGSGNVTVLATPEMVRLMERASVAAVDHLLPSGQRTVGIRLDVRHLAATPVSMRVTARSELVAVEGRKLTFRVEAHDEVEKVGEGPSASLRTGTHWRTIIDVDRFRSRVERKRHADP